MRHALRHIMRQAVHLLTAACFLGTAVLLPAASAQAAAGQFNPTWHNRYVADGTTNVVYPADNWHDIGTAKQSSSGTYDFSMTQGQRWIVDNNPAAGILGLNSIQAGKLLIQAAEKPPIVFARYFLEDAELRLQAFRVIRTPDHILHMQMADWTPWHGALFARDRYFLSATEKANPFLVGNDPLQRFGNPSILAQSPTNSQNYWLRTDPVFYNISWPAAQVAIGLAMAHFHSLIGFISIPKLSLQQTETTSGSLLRKTVTITTRGYATPQWYVATPPSAQPYAQTAEICAVQVASGASCDDVGHMVPSGIAVQQWQGGDLPQVTDLLYTNVESHSGWTILAFALLATAFAFAGGLALGTMATGSAGWTTAAIGGQIGGGIGGSAVGAIAGTAAGTAYAVGSTVLSHGGAVTQPQSNFLGSTGWGVINAGAPNNQYAQGLQSNVEAREIQTNTQQALTGDQELLQGSCAGWTSRTDCTAAGGTAGVMPRTDDYRAPQRTPQMQRRYAKCEDEGYTGPNLQRCAAGALLTPSEAIAVQTGGWTVSTSAMPPSDTSTNTAAPLFYDNSPPSQ